MGRPVELRTKPLSGAAEHAIEVFFADVVLLADAVAVLVLQIEADNHVPIPGRQFLDRGSYERDRLAAEQRVGRVGC